MNLFFKNELKKNTLIDINEIIIDESEFFCDKFYFYYLKYNIFKILIEKKYIHFHEAFYFIDNTNKDELIIYLNNNSKYSFKQIFINSNINGNLPYSYEHYLIYHLFDWYEINNLQLDYYSNKNSFFIHFINNKKPIDLILNNKNDIDDYIININNNLDRYFLETDLLKQIIIENQNNIIIKEIITILTKCQKKLNYKLKLIDDLKDIINKKDNYIKIINIENKEDNSFIHNNIDFEEYEEEDEDNNIIKKSEYKLINNNLLKIFIINLEKDIESKIKLENNLKHENIYDFEFFKGVYALKDKKANKLFKEYEFKYENHKIPRKTLGVEKLHIQNIGALGVILSTFNLYKYINETYSYLDHVIILEDDVYLKKNFHQYYNINESDLKNIDFLYLGHNCRNEELIKFREKSNNQIIEIDNKINKINIYGAYSFICSLKYRKYVLNKGIDYFINNNLNLDCFYLMNYKNKDNDLKIKLYKDHLFIPEVRKNGIQDLRGIEFYNDRNIDLNDFNIN